MLKSQRNADLGLFTKLMVAKYISFKMKEAITDTLHVAEIK